MHLADATERLPEFRRLMGDIPYERKGILFSEMFFLWVLAQRVAPKRVLESGRARGQSTVILSRCFPDAEIISVEFDRDSPDVAVAADRLRNCNNVKQVFGDATKILPALAQEDDIALIDGPKGYRGLRLAIRLLASGLPLVFLHDTAKGSSERRYLTRRMPEALYSDQPEFAAPAHSLDEGWEQGLPPANRWTPHGPPAAGYGFSLACLPRLEDRSYRSLLIDAVFDGLRHRWFKR